MNKVTFHKDGHKYIHEDGRRFISVTQLIKQYSNDFEEEYWSLYKAIKDVLSDKNMWTIFKKSAGGWEKVVDYWKTNQLYADRVYERQSWYKHEWEQNREDACKYGTAVHSEKEQKIRQSSVINGKDGLIYTVGREDYYSEIIEYPDFQAIKVFPEALVYDEEYEIAGQVDRIDQNKILVDITDYKTSKEITQSSFRDQTMKPPLHDVYDSNYYHYLLQVSTYAWMLERRGYQVGRLKLYHTRSSKDIYFAYRRDLVERMVRHYAEQKKGY